MPTTIALFSDIHANLPALEAVLDDLDRRDVDALYCLGDLVGYAPWPNEVVEGVGLGSDDCGCAYQTDEDKARGVEESLLPDAFAEMLREAY